MRELSLFSGAGGGLLGTKLLGWEAVGYVEFNEYCQKVLRARIKDGILDEAPIFGDIRAFISEGYARAYQGMVDVVSGGFPCQPFSHAGKRAGKDDSRNMWGETLEVIRQVQPRFAFLENVSGLLSIDDGRYFGRILGDLGESGYDVRWRVLSAAEVGAPHKRDRLWILADSIGGADCTERGAQRKEAGYEGIDRKAGLAGVPIGTSNEPEVLGDSYTARKLQQERSKQKIGGRASNTGENVSDTNSERCKRGERSGWIDTQRRKIENGQTAKRGQVWWEQDPADPDGTTKPQLGRVAHGVGHRMDRLKAIGNGQVPAVVAEAWRLLSCG